MIFTMKRTPYTQNDFTWAHWTPEDIKKIPDYVISTKKERLADIKKVRAEERNFENTVYALQASDYSISESVREIDLLQNVAPKKEVRDASKKAIEIIEKKLIAIERDPKIWKALKEYHEGAWEHEQKTLPPEDLKLFNDIYRSYKRMGFDLPPGQQKRLKALEQELSKQSNTFRHNINSYHDALVVAPKDMEGLPSRYLEGLKRDKQGNYLVTLAYPDVNPFMELMPNESLRRAMSAKSLRKGGEKNLDVLKNMIALREERAKILGYKTHADYKTELRMAKNGKTAVSFVEDLLKKVERGGRKDLAELLALKKKRTGNKEALLHPYDVAYYAHELQKEKFSIDSEEVRQYFPLERVLAGTFQIYSTLFGVTFEKLTGKNAISLWHPDAELYSIKTKDGNILSYFALDLFPREGKFGHAAMFDIISGRELSYHGEGYRTPFAAMVCNFTKPSEAHPSLLSHGEAETFLHEFGHTIHHTLTQARNLSQAGSNTVWDFVEAPSQMLENWAWNKKSLALLSTHHETGKPLPAKLLNNLLLSKEHLVRYDALRQLILGIFDLTLHTKGTKNITKLYSDLIKKYTGLTTIKESIFPAGFGHLDGYDAGYYGYMWSKVYAADMFTRFEKEGILNKKTGLDYRRAILEQGGSRDELELVEQFLKRKPNNKAFLKEIGITK
jgi:thimet oligopeptidase